MSLFKRLLLMPFYAVRVGRKPGIYSTWSECEHQVKGHPRARYKKFNTEEEAQEFITQGSHYATPNALSPKKTVEFKSKTKVAQQSQLLSKTNIKCEVEKVSSVTEDSLRHEFVRRDSFPTAPVVYSDGCCRSNGKSGAIGGIGVYWAPQHHKNVSEFLDVDKPTNQIAELRAASRALETAIEMGLPSVELRTDSIYTIKSMTEWIGNWRMNGWKTTSYKDVCNKGEMIRLSKLCRKINVLWVHVPGHANNYGNVEADRLANEGALKGTFSSR